MSSLASEKVVSPTITNTESPTPSTSIERSNTDLGSVDIVMKVKNEQSCNNEDLNSLLIREGQQLDNSRNSHIPSPPTITNWHTMSTAATTITSNIHSSTTKRKPPYMPTIYSTNTSAIPLDRRCMTGVVVDDELHNNPSITDAPPVCEIQIPRSRQHRDEDDDDDDDEDTTTSTQNLSKDDGQHTHLAIDYKNMYFSSQRQNYTLQEHVQCIQEDNRKLKRQLIEMQKQLYTLSRNKRQAVSSNHSNHPYHTNNRMDVAPWSIPMSSQQQHSPKQHTHRRVIMVRHPTHQHQYQREHEIPDHGEIIRPSSMITTGNTITMTSTTTNTSLPGLTSSPSKGISMSVSSEEGNCN